MTFNIDQALDELQEKPGVYLMKDDQDEIIYVGKAINLRRRVRQYFSKSGQKNKKVQVMVQHIKSFETIIVNNEVEALILESNLIKENRPKYNILLRDDKSYPYIKITNEPFPRILKVRKVEKDGAEYFGPYPNAYAVNDIINLFHDSFKIRNCTLNFKKGQYLKRPCLNYFIDRCLGPCIKKVSEERYEKEIAPVREFLKGDTEDFTQQIEDKMYEASSELNFELAAQYRDALESIDHILEKQSVSSASDLDIDMIALARDEELICVQVFMVRNGKIVERENFFMEDAFYEGDREVLAKFLQQFYLDLNYIPKLILLDFYPDNTEALQEMLTEAKGTKVELRIPERGHNVDLMEMARKNAKSSLVTHIQKVVRRNRNKQVAVEDLEQFIGKAPIERIEAYDISNISGVQSTGSMIVFENGVKAPGEYRKFKIRSVKGPDDYASLKEVLTRRFNRGLKERKERKDKSGFGAFPDVIMIDGGKGQVNVALEVLKTMNLDIPVIGLVEDHRKHLKSIIYENKETKVEVGMAIYRLLFQIQQEAHRFAINYHRKLRSDQLFKSELDDIEGIGEIRKRSLLTHFGSIENIKKQSVEKLVEAPRMTITAAQSVYDYFHKGET